MSVKRNNEKAVQFFFVYNYIFCVGFIYGSVATQKLRGLLGTELENRFEGLRCRKSKFA